MQPLMQLPAAAFPGQCTQSAPGLTPMEAAHASSVVSSYRAALEAERKARVGLLAHLSAVLAQHEQSLAVVREKLALCDGQLRHLEEAKDAPSGLRVGAKRARAAEQGAAEAEKDSSHAKRQKISAPAEQHDGAPATTTPAAAAVNAETGDDDEQGDGPASANPPS
eukprot:TRINITY_DN13048_c0_g1_i1.p1 TRINITY_DN13048_c0_g1~~TRINITY_DN13048_c0_g1_i1.p1  ORF type:complete len:166 (-),score=36.87 TRINITY_DN13048_c0_g1_i1:343-840(-)